MSINSFPKPFLFSPGRVNKQERLLFLLGFFSFEK